MFLIANAICCTETCLKRKGKKSREREMNFLFVSFFLSLSLPNDQLIRFEGRRSDDVCESISHVKSSSSLEIKSWSCGNVRKWLTIGYHRWSECMPTEIDWIDFIFRSRNDHSFELQKGVNQLMYQKLTLQSTKVFYWIEWMEVFSLLWIDVVPWFYLLKRICWKNHEQIFDEIRELFIQHRWLVHHRWKWEN